MSKNHKSKAASAAPVTAPAAVSTASITLDQIALRRAELEKMEQDLRQAQIDAKNAERAKFEALPAQVGLATVAELISALKGLSAKSHRLTDEVRLQIRAAITAGRTGKQVASDFGVSVPTVQAIKKAAGMVRARADKAIA